VYEKHIKTINNIGNLYKEEIYNSESRILTKDIAYKKEVVNGKTKCYNIIETEVFYTDNLVIPDRMISYETDSYTGNVTRRTLENPEDILDESQYLYDKTGQLTEEKKPYEQTRSSYLYDNSGNVLKVEKFDINSSLSLGKTEFTYDTVIPNRLLSITKDGVTKTIVYSDALPGMPISINNGIYTQTLEWSGSKLTKYDYENGKSLSFTYDSSNQRTKKVLTDNISLGTITHNYRYSSNKLIEEYVIDDIKGDEYKLHYLYDESGKLYGFEYGTNTYYYLRDTLLNIIGIINTSGQIVCEYKYDAYGNHKVLNSNRVETTSVNFIGNINPFRYKGYYYDVETQLYWVSSRYYSPELCRWISPDSIEYLDPESINGLNLYCYCMNNPIMYFDPTGCFALSISFITIIVALVSATAITTLAYETDNTDVVSDGISDSLENINEKIKDYLTEINIAILLIIATLKQKTDYNKTEIHHIVPRKDPRGEISRQILDNVGIGIEDPKNKVELPKGYHRVMHTNLYYFYLNGSMIVGYLFDDKEGVETVLGLWKKLLGGLNNGSVW